MTQQELFNKPAALTLYKAEQTGEMKKTGVILFPTADDLFDYITRLANMKRYDGYGIQTGLKDQNKC